MPKPIEDYLDVRAVCLNIEASSAEEVIRLLGERLEALGKVRSSYAAAVALREETMPTGLPLGEINVAVPHTDPHHVVDAALAIATLRTPVPFGNMEDPDETIPVRVAVAMALTDKNEQIDMLQRIASLIQNPDALSALVDAATPEAAIAAFASIKVEE